MRILRFVYISVDNLLHLLLFCNCVMPSLIIVDEYFSRLSEEIVAVSDNICDSSGAPCRVALTDDV